MSKGKFITLILFVMLIVLNIVLFGFVFVLKKQSVEYIDDVKISQENIIKAAGLENGKSTLLIDKESAIKNIEEAYPQIKVIQIETISLFEIKIVVKTRYELYYVSLNNKYYILDEDLKVLNIVEQEPLHLIKITNDLGVSENTKKCSFVGSENQKVNLLNLYIAMYSAVITSDGAQARVDICSNINSVTLEDDKIIILTDCGVVLDIAKPEHNLTNKINLCFSTINKLIQDSESLQGRTIKIFYEINGNNEYKCYLSPANNSN